MITAETIVLTGTPEELELRREFRELDQREEDLKRAGFGVNSEPRQAVMKRKREITGLIFKLSGLTSAATQK